MRLLSLVSYLGRTRKAASEHIPSCSSCFAVEALEGMKFQIANKVHIPFNQRHLISGSKEHSARPAAELDPVELYNTRC